MVRPHTRPTILVLYALDSLILSFKYSRSEPGGQNLLWENPVRDCHIALARWAKLRDSLSFFRYYSRDNVVCVEYGYD